MAHQQLTLYQYWRSSCSWRVRWALAIKGIHYKSASVNLLKNDQRQQDFLKKSPMGLVPCIEYQGQFISESIAIIEWLDERFGGPSLLPANPWDKAKVRELASIIASDTQPIQNLRIMRRHSQDLQQQKEWARLAIHEGFTAFEKCLRSSAGTYCWGGSLTLADICLVPQVYNAHRFNVDMKKFPLCESIYQRCLKLPSCDEAAPHNQPDAISP